jgi:hypothetical protein
VNGSRFVWRVAARHLCHCVIVVVEKQNGRGLSGYEVLPDGRKDPFVGVFKRDGKHIIISTEQGPATADVAGDEIEWCWQDNLPTVSVAVCDVMKKAQ